MGMLARIKAAVGVSLQGLMPASGNSWMGVIREPFTGAWQRNIEIRRDTVLSNWAVFSCMTLISSDIGKMQLKLMELLPSGVWQETDSPAFSPVLRKPNRYQTRQKFIEQWLVSKLSWGNTYILKERDDRGVVVALYILDPQRVKPLVSPDGSVYYDLADDRLAGLQTSLPAVPASEIIHDTMVCLFHPLMGVSPIFACGLAATQGLKIQHNSALFFQNLSRPGGIITAPAQIDDETAKRLKTTWEENYSGANSGKVAVLGDGLKYEAMDATNAVDSDLVDQLKLTAEMVCSTFHVPPFKVGMGAIPAGQKVGDLNQIYYSDCLQALIESIEALLDDGLGLTTPKDGRRYGTYLELDDLLRMDPMTMVQVTDAEVKGGWLKPDEARLRRNLGKVPGGDTPYMQQQNFSLAALEKRDQRDDPFAAGSQAPAPAPAPTPQLPASAPAAAPDEGAKAFIASLRAKFVEAGHVA